MTIQYTVERGSLHWIALHTSHFSERALERELVDRRRLPAGRWCAPARRVVVLAAAELLGRSFRYDSLVSRTGLPFTLFLSGIFSALYRFSQTRTRRGCVCPISPPGMLLPVAEICCGSLGCLVRKDRDIPKKQVSRPQHPVCWCGHYPPCTTVPLQ